MRSFDQWWLDFGDQETEEPNQDQQQSEAVTIPGEVRSDGNLTYQTEYHLSRPISLKPGEQFQLVVAQDRIKPTIEAETKFISPYIAKNYNVYLSNGSIRGYDTIELMKADKELNNYGINKITDIYDNLSSEVLGQIEEEH